MTWAVASNIAEQIGWGLRPRTHRRALRAACCPAPPIDVDGSAPDWRQIAPWGWRCWPARSALLLGGSGFIAAFAGGIAFGSVSGARSSLVDLFTEETGGLLAAVTWIGFGALASPWPSRTSPGR